MKIKFPGVKILDRYIMRKFLGTYIFAIALISVIVVIFDAAEKIDDFIELKAPLSKIAFSYYLNFIPFFINQFSGLFTFIAVIFFTSKMAYQTEIIAILSGNNPKMVPFAAFFLAYIRVGADLMSRRSDVQNELVSIIQAVLILFVTAERFMAGWKQREEAKKALKGEA